MIKGLLITHGSLAHALLETAEMILGRMEDVGVISIKNGENIEIYCPRAYSTLPATGFASSRASLPLLSNLLGLYLSSYK